MLNASLNIYSSDWASAHARDAYRIDSEKIHTIPLGANLKDIPERVAVEEQVKHKHPNNPKLLFVGYDWERKGGEQAVALLRQLRSIGLNARLSIVGCTPEIQGSKDGLDMIGKLDKKKPEDAAMFERLMTESHFLVLPSKADCTAIVFSEAAAYGLPVLTTEVGGHGSIICHGENGFLYEPGIPAPLMAEDIQQMASKKYEYERMALNARRVFDERLSWDSGINRLIGLFHELLDEAIELRNVV